jgi:hypothetical protein
MISFILRLRGEKLIQDDRNQRIAFLGEIGCKGLKKLGVLDTHYILFGKAVEE